MPDETVTTTEAPPAAPEVKEEPKSGHDDPKFRDAVEEQVARRMGAWSKFGTPEEATESLNALAYYGEIERQALEEASKSKTGEMTDETAKQYAEARDVLYGKVDPVHNDLISKEQGCR